MHFNKQQLIYDILEYNTMSLQCVSARVKIAIGKMSENRANAGGRRGSIKVPGQKGDERTVKTIESEVRPRNKKTNRARN